jgi:hypothetical protein
MAPPRSTSRLSFDIKQLKESEEASESSELNGEDEDAEPRMRGENAVGVIGVIYVVALAIPGSLKQGQAWYIALHSIALLSSIPAVAGIFWGNTHNKILLFIFTKIRFWQILILALTDWVLWLAKPDVGYEVTDRLSATTQLILRVAFFCLDACRGMRRNFRLLTVVVFIFGNGIGVVQAYFMFPAQDIVTIAVTNVTLTTTRMRASVTTTMISLTLSMAVTIWRDKMFLFMAISTARLPKIAIDSRIPALIKLDRESAMAFMEQLQMERRAALAAWQGRPQPAELVCLLSLVIMSLSIIVGATRVSSDSDGRESVVLIVMRVLALVLLFFGVFSLFWHNLSLPRLRYTFLSPQGILITFYACAFALVGWLVPDPRFPVSSVLGPVYMALGFLFWLALECVKKTSRWMRAAITALNIFSISATIILSLYFWPRTDDVMFIPLGGVSKFSLWRTILCNLLFLGAGSLKVIFKDSQSDFMAIIHGSVTRKDVLALSSLRDTIIGDSTHEVVEGSRRESIRRNRVSSTMQYNPAAP